MSLIGKYITLITVLFLSIPDIKAQKFIEPDKLKAFNITVNFDNYTVKTQMLSAPKEIKVNTERTYMWYTSQKIMETVGGYNGRLIHGSYYAFYLNNQLKEQGYVKYGLKNKEWKSWYPDGKLMEIVNWKNGVKNGTYILYNDQGQKMVKSNFKNDKLDGKFISYGPSGNIIEKKKFKQGVEVLPPVKKEKMKKPKKEKAVKEPSAEEKPAKAKKPGIFKKIFKPKKKASKPNEKSLKTA